MRARRKAIFFLILLLTSLVPFFPIPPVEGAGASWLSGWDYRIQYNVTGSTAGQQTDYQVKIETGLFLDLPPNNASHQTTPTSDASGQVVHPSILYFPAGWNGYKYWMAMTPYPVVGGDDMETPEILACDDGVNWVVPTHLTNPIVARDAVAPNTDPCLFYNEATNELWVYYRKTQNAVYDRLYLKKTANGTDWSGTGLGTLLLDVGFGELLSPYVEKVGATYHLWYVNSSVAPNVIEHRTSADGETFGAPATVTLNGVMPNGREPWHVGIRYMSAYSEYWMFMSITDLGGTGGPGWNLFAKSENATDWYIYPDILLKSSVAGWDRTMTYKSTFLLDGTELKLWYSARNHLAEWHIGLTNASLGNFDLFSNAQTDGGDIRVTSADGITELDYFIEDFDLNTRWGAIWVTVPTIPASPGITTLYVYYGNSGSTTTGDGDVVFPWVFDDLANYSIGDSPNTYDWNTVGLGVGNTIKVAQDPDDATLQVFEFIESGDGTLNELHADLDDKRPAYAFHFRLKVDSDERYYVDGQEDGGPFISIARVHTVDKWQWYNGGAYVDFNPIFPAPHIWYDWEMHTMDTGEFYMNLINNDDDLNYTGDWRDTPVVGINTIRLTLQHNAGALKMYVGGIGNESRYIFVRKFVQPEPTFDTWGSEESAGGPPNTAPVLGAYTISDWDGEALYTDGEFSNWWLQATDADGGSDIATFETAFLLGSDWCNFTFTSSTGLWVKDTDAPITIQNDGQTDDGTIKNALGILAIEDWAEPTENVVVYGRVTDASSATSGWGVLPGVGFSVREPGSSGDTGGYSDPGDDDEDDDEVDEEPIPECWMMDVDNLNSMSVDALRVLADILGLPYTEDTSKAELVEAIYTEAVRLCEEGETPFSGCLMDEEEKLAKLDYLMGLSVQELRLECQSLGISYLLWRDPEPYIILIFTVGYHCSPPGDFDPEDWDGDGTENWEDPDMFDETRMGMGARIEDIHLEESLPWLKGNGYVLIILLLVFAFFYSQVKKKDKPGSRGESLIRPRQGGYLPGERSKK